MKPISTVKPDFPGTVPGIYDRCDHWCQRCHAKKKCVLYLSNIVQSFQNDPLAENEHSMSIDFQCLSLPDDLLDRLGIESDELIDEEKMPEIDIRFQKINELATTLGDLSVGWLKTTDLDDYTDELIIEAIETIVFYGWIIPVKVLIASLQFTVSDGKDTEFNGSAKVALLSLNKAFESCMYLYEKLSKYQDAYLQIMKVQTSLRQEIEREFPHAMAYIRLGLDD